MTESFSMQAPQPKKKASKIRKRAAAVGLTLGILFATTFATAAWLASASAQHGYTKYGSLQAVTTVDISGSVTGNCFPGTTCDLKFRFSNPNPQAVTVSTVDASGATFTGLGTCTTTGASINGVSSIPVAISVPGSGTADFTATNKVAIDNTANTNCQNQVLDVGGLTVNTTT